MMDRRALKFNSKRTEIEIETHTTTNSCYLQSQPLKDNSNIRIIRLCSEPTQIISANNINSLKEHQHLQQSSLNGNNNNTIKDINSVCSKGSERPLKCLETLAQKAGIIIDEKYDFSSPPHSSSFFGNSKSPITRSATPIVPTRPLIMEKSQSPAQQLTSSTAVPLQISPEQLQQLQHLQLQHSSPFAIQVKQEFPTHATTTAAHQLSSAAGGGGELKHANIIDQSQLQQMQMQLAEAAGGAVAPNSPAAQQTPSSSAVANIQQHSATISTMSPMQLTSTGQMSGDWSQGRTVQVMQQPTALNSGFLYHPQMLVSGNIFHSTGLTQQPIQVIAASKPFQGGAPQMITTTTQNAKQMLSGNASFSSGTYAIPSSQSPQTFLFSPMNPVNVISPSPQQQNILQTMAAAAAANVQQQQQQNIGKVNTGQEAQKNIQQKVVQKVTNSTVQSTAGTASSGNITQQQQHHAQQCVQVSSQTGMPTTTQIIGQIQGSTGGPQQMQITAPWLPVWPNGLQQLTQNPIIIRGPQADGSPGGMFIQQPAAHQTLQASQQPNQITLQCNVAQPQTKPRNHLEAIVAKQQQAQVTQSQQSTVNALAQQQAVGVATATQLQQQTPTTVVPQRTSQLLPQNSSQLRPASSVSTQTAQNQSMLKHKIRSKQQPVRPALPAMKSEGTQQKAQSINAVGTAGLQQLTTIANSATQHQQPTMHQVVTSAGNKMVVMSAGTPITIQSGQGIPQATAPTHLDKQSQQQQIQLQQMQKQQLLQQQLFQQQFAQIQIQQQQQQQQQTSQIQLQMAPATAQAILAQQQQQQQQQLQNQILQQHQLQQREQQNIIHQIVVQQSPQQQQQNSLATSISQHQQHQLQQQQQITAVPIVASSSSASVVSACGTLQNQQVTYQTKSQTMPTTSIVTISNQTSPLVTSSVGVNQATQLQHNFITATIASHHPQQSQMPQSQHSTQNPILAMASMINASSNVGNTTMSTATSSHNTNVTSSTTQPVVSISATNITSSPLSSLTPTPTKTNSIDSNQNSQVKNNTSACSTPSTSAGVADTATRIPLSIASSNANTVLNATNAPVALSVTEVRENIEKLQQKGSTGSDLDTTSTTSSLSVSTEQASELSAQIGSKTIAVNITPATSNTLEQPLLAKNNNTTTVTALSQLKNAGCSSCIADTNNTNIEVLEPTEQKLSSATSISLKEENQSTSTASYTTSAPTLTTMSMSKTASGTAVKIEKTDLPKAMIKPNVLTHVIDDFIIQEGSEPFPVTRQRYVDKDTSDEPPKKKSALEELSAHSANLSLPPVIVSCENCGKAEHKAKVKKKRFCSLTCARQAKSSSNEQPMEVIGNNENTGTVSSHITNSESVISASVAGEKMHVDLSEHSNGLTSVLNGHQQAPENASAANDCSSTPNSVPVSIVGGEQPQMMNWSVSEVCEFIKNLPGCSDYVDDFEQQEIDGQALLLLKENHLVNAMGMKLGPALKIVAKVESMKEVNVPTNATNTEKETTSQ